MKQALCCILILAMFSCRNRTEDQKSQPEVIDLSGAITNKGREDLSSIASAVEYVPLEATEHSWVSQVNGVQVTPRNIYIFDRSQNLLFQFDLSGKFKRRIGVEGRGPHEYTRIGSFDVHSPSKGGKETIGIIDSATEYISFFDEEGNFISRFKPAAVGTGISFLKDDTVVVELHKALLSELNEGYSLNFYSRNGELLCRARTTDIIYEGNNPAYGGSFRKYKTAFQYYEPYERSIYKINSSGEVKRKYVFELGSNALPLEDLMTTDMSDKTYELHSIIESDHYIFSEFMDNRYRVTAFYSKETKEAKNVIFNYDVIDQGFHNDIDGGMPFWPSNTSHDGKWVSYFYPSDAHRKLNDSYFDSYAIKDNAARKDLLQLVAETENPIIQLTTPK